MRRMSIALKPANQICDSISPSVPIRMWDPPFLFLFFLVPPPCATIAFHSTLPKVIFRVQWKTYFPLSFSNAKYSYFSQSRNAFWLCLNCLDAGLCSSSHDDHSMQFLLPLAFWRGFLYKARSTYPAVWLGYPSDLDRGGRRSNAALSARRVGLGFSYLAIRACTWSRGPYQRPAEKPTWASARQTDLQPERLVPLLGCTSSSAASENSCKQREIIVTKSQPPKLQWSFNIGSGTLGAPPYICPQSNLYIP